MKENALKLKKNYTTDKIQIMKVGGNYSDASLVNDVPQGSVLGPRLFMEISIFSYCLVLHMSEPYILLFGQKLARNRCKQLMSLLMNENAIHAKFNFTLSSRPGSGKHINYGCNHLRLIYANHAVISFNLHLMICESLVFSHLNYCDVF